MAAPASPESAAAEHGQLTAGGMSDAAFDFYAFGEPEDLYDAQASERTAQHFLVTPAGMGAQESSNVIWHVHAPSGARQLTSKQRTRIFREFAAMTSLIDASKSGGNDRYIIAGDLNTGSAAAEHGQCIAAGMSYATLTVCTMHHVLTRVVHYWSGRPGTVVEV